MIKSLQSIFQYPLTNFSNSTLISYPTQYNLTEKIFHAYSFFTFYFILPFIPFGIIFNFLSLVIFSRTALGTTSSTRVYYIVMAYTEMTTVFLKDFWFFWFGVGFPSVFKLDPLSQIHLNPHSKTSLGPLCNIMIFLYFIHEMVANMTFVLFAIERVIVLYYPFSRYWFNQKRALVAIGVLFTFEIPIALITFWHNERVNLSGLVFTGFMCIHDIRNKSPLANALSSFNIFVVFIFPALLSATCSIIIIIKMISR